MNAAALPLALAVIAGIFIAIQAPTNAILGKASGSPVVAAFISFVVGTLALGAMVAASSGRVFAPELKGVPGTRGSAGFMAPSSSPWLPLRRRELALPPC